MTRIDDAPKRIHELPPEGTSESAQNARLGDSRTIKIKSIFLIVGIVLCVIFVGSTQSKAQGIPSIPYAPGYNAYNSESQSYFNAYQSTQNMYDYYMGYAFYFYYLANYYGDWYGFNVDTFGNHSDQHLSATSYNPSTKSVFWYNYYAYNGDLWYHYANLGYSFSYSY